MSGILLCCGEEGINPLACDRGNWGREASMLVASSELQEQEKSPLTSFFVTAFFFQNREWSLLAPNRLWFLPL